MIDFTPFLIENAHSIDFGDFDIVVYLEKNHSFITLFLQSGTMEKEYLICYS